MKRLVLPNLCRNSTTLVIILLSQLAVIVVWLLLPRHESVTSLGLASIYSLFVALIATIFICVNRQWIAKQAFLSGVFIALTLMVMSQVIVELAFQMLLVSTYLENFNLPQLLRRAIAALLASCILLRFFTLIEHFEQRSQAEAEARVLALQSRIQPHFLFNSLNTISELAVTDALKAEAAITALASLFRASLENERNYHSLEQEIALCERYLGLERFRIQDKLEVQWQVSVKATQQWCMPKLMLQPLVENALVHGMQETGSVSVKLDIRETSRHISVMIENKVGEARSEKTGHGIAIKNIQQRLETLYDDQFTFRSKEVEGYYQVLLRIPKQAYK